MGRVHPVPFEGLAPPEFGQERGAPQVRIRTIPLDAARDKEEIKIGGNFLWASSATDNATEVNVSFDRETADDGITFKNGTRVSGLEFARIFLSHAAQVGKTITFVYAVEAGRRGLEIDNPAGDFTSVALVRPTTAGSDVDGSINAATSAVVKAVTTTRTRLVVEADINNTTDLRVGPTVSDTEGRVLTPGAAAIFFSTVAISVRNPTGGDASQGYRYYEELD